MRTAPWVQNYYARPPRKRLFVTKIHPLPCSNVRILQPPPPVSPSRFLRLRRRLVGIGLLLALLLPSVVAAQEVPSCAELLTEGERSYLLGRFDEAIQQATNCLRQGDVPEETAVRAFRLQALAQLKLDDLEAAKTAISNLLNLAPRYEPDPVQEPPAYISLVAIVKQERGPVAPVTEERPSWLRRNWGWVAGGGGLVLTGLVTLLVGSGGEGGSGGGGEPLPPPPTPPSN